MLIVKYRKFFYIFSSLVVIAAIASIAFFGLRFGIEFTGGEIAEINYATRPAKTEVIKQLDALSIGAYSLRTAGTSQFILRTKSLTEAQRSTVLKTLGNPESGVTGTIERFNSVGPTIGHELRTKALLAIIIVALAIIFFIGIAFRGVSKPVSSWKYGVIAIVALLHDVIIPTGLFAILGFVFGAEVNVLFVMAILAILGYSVNDTIVVFDRVRENLRKNEEQHRKEDFELTVGKSLNQTFVRSVNTSLTTLIALLALFFFGSSVTQDFALVLIAGVIAGTYSSICIATPLLVTVQKWMK